MQALQGLELLKAVLILLLRVASVLLIQGMNNCVGRAGAGSLLPIQIPLTGGLERCILWVPFRIPVLGPDLSQAFISLTRVQWHLVHCYSPQQHTKRRALCKPRCRHACPLWRSIRDLLSDTGGNCLIIIYHVRKAQMTGSALLVLSSLCIQGVRLPLAVPENRVGHRKSGKTSDLLLLWRPTSV